MDRYELLCRIDRHHQRRLDGATFRSAQSSDPIPPYVTTGQQRVLGALAELRYACSGRIALHLGVHKRTVERSLEPLRAKRMVGWFRWIDTSLISAENRTGPLGSRCVYCLTDLGASRCLMDGVVESDRHLITRNYRGKPILYGAVPHNLGIVDVIIGLRLAERRSIHEILWTLPDFVSERDGGSRKVATREPLGGKSEMRPDMVSVLRSGTTGQTHTLYVEFERAVKDRDYVSNKLKNYSALFRRKKRRFDHGPPILLYVIEKYRTEKWRDDRTESVIQLAREHHVAPAFRIASVDDVVNDAFGPVWTKVDGTSWSIGGRR